MANSQADREETMKSNSLGERPEPISNRSKHRKRRSREEKDNGFRDQDPLLKENGCGHGLTRGNNGRYLIQEESRR